MISAATSTWVIFRGHLYDQYKNNDENEQKKKEKNFFQLKKKFYIYENCKYLKNKNHFNLFHLLGNELLIYIIIIMKPLGLNTEMIKSIDKIQYE